MGAVAGRPAGAAHLVAQVQLGVALAGQGDADARHFRLRPGQAFALGAEGFERQLGQLQAALCLVLALQVVVRAAAQGFGGVGNLAAGSGALGAAVCGQACGVFQVAVCQLQRLQFGAGAGHVVLGSAPARFIGTGAGRGQGAL